MQKKAEPEKKPYVSVDPEADFARFKDTLRAAVSVPKECVDKAIEDEKRERQMKKAGAKDG